MISFNDAPSSWECISLAMSAVTAQAASAAPGTAARDAEERDGAARVPLCFVVDGDASIRHFLSLVLQGVGIDTEEFADGAAFRAASFSTSRLHPPTRSSASSRWARKATAATSSS
jgi:hypothetical protein